MASIGRKQGHSEQIGIAHVVMSHHMGGLERMVAGLLAELDHDRYRLVLCCIEKEGDWVPALRTEVDAVFVMEKNPGVGYGLPFRFARLFRSQHIDLVHCHNFGAYLYAGLGARLAGSCAVVYTLHGPEMPADRARSFLHRLPIAHRLVTVSERMRVAAIERGGIDPDRVMTIPNGVKTDTDVAAMKDTCIRKELSVGTQSFVFGCVARLSPEKDHDTLLEAFARVLRAEPDARLVLVGDGPLYAHLRELAKTLEVSANVYFLGARDDIDHILATLDGFVLASRHEGLPVALLEAMAAGVPVIATLVGGIPEAVSHGVTGVLVPSGSPELLAEAMLGLIEKRGDSRLMGIRARRWVSEKYDISRMAQAYDDLYLQLLSRARRSGRG